MFFSAFGDFVFSPVSFDELRSAWTKYQAEKAPEHVPFFGQCVQANMVYAVLAMTIGTEFIIITADEYTRDGDYLREVRFRLDRTSRTGKMLLELVKAWEAHPLYVPDGLIYLGTEGLKVIGENLKRYESFIFMKRTTKKQRARLTERGYWPYTFDLSKLDTPAEK